MLSDAITEIKRRETLPPFPSDFYRLGTPTRTARHVLWVLYWSRHGTLRAGNGFQRVSSLARHFLERASVLKVAGMGMGICRLNRCSPVRDVGAPGAG